MDKTQKLVVLSSLLRILKKGSGKYGYDVWLPDSVMEHSLLSSIAKDIVQQGPIQHQQQQVVWVSRMPSAMSEREREVAKQIFPLIADALWFLCGNGLLRPGIRDADAQSVPQGTGYSFTLRGRDWVRHCSDNDATKMLDEL